VTSPVSLRRSALVVLVLAVFVVGTFAGATVAAFAGWRIDLAGSTPKPAATSEAAFVDACHEAVKAKLKAPATAQFSHESINTPTDKAKNIVGDLDSQNGFGALVRSHYRCFAYIVDGRWHVDSTDVKDQ
jgi:hypothetical protein